MKTLYYIMTFKLKSFYYWASYFVVRSYLSLSNSNLKVISTDDTIQQVLNKKCSVSRFGDGEMRLITNESIEFQQSSSDLALRLKEVLLSNHPNHIVCLPDVFSSLKFYKPKIRFFWRRHLSKYHLDWNKYINPERVYYSTFMTRPYIDYKDTVNSKARFENIRRIWQERDVVIVEGYKSRLGVGNDLFSNVKSIERILCPSVNAFSKYQEIFSAARQVDKNKLILIALGPAATVLAFDLHNCGFHAIDIGHIDIEYEWFLMGAKEKVDIPHKHTNEAIGNNAPEVIDDVVYNSQIIVNLIY